MGSGMIRKARGCGEPFWPAMGATPCCCHAIPGASSVTSAAAGHALRQPPHPPAARAELEVRPLDVSSLIDGLLAAGKARVGAAACAPIFARGAWSGRGGHHRAAARRPPHAQRHPAGGTLRRCQGHGPQLSWCCSAASSVRQRVLAWPNPRAKAVVVVGGGGESTIRCCSTYGAALGMNSPRPWCVSGQPPDCGFVPSWP